MRLVEFSVRHPMFGHLLTLFLLVAGLMAAFSLQREVFPATDLDLILIRTPYPSASPEEVEDLVTTPLEEELRDIEEIEEYRSVSMEGLSTVIIQIDGDVKDKQAVLYDVQRSVDRVDFPEESKDSLVEMITTDQPIIFAYVAGGEDEFARKRYAELLKDRLADLPDAASVVRMGWRDEEFWVELNPEKLEATDLSVTDVMDALGRRNVNLPGGKIPAEGGEVVLRTTGKFYTEAEISEVVIRSNFDGQAVQVKDVGVVRRTFEPDATYRKVRGERAILLGVKKRGSGDAIRLADSVKDILEEEQGRIGDAFVLGTTDDSSFYVKRRLKVVMTNGLMGIIMVTVCLMLVMDFRISLFTAFGIPFSFLGAFFIMYLTGVSINLMTMFGMIIVLGMIVDDAIIVGENIYRYLEAGYSREEAARLGASEVALPVVATVLTTIAAFAPLFFAPDVYSKYLGWLVIVVVVTLLASLTECLVVLPAHAAEWGTRRRAKAGKGGHRKGGGHRIMGAIVRRYTRVLRWCLRFRYVVLVGVFVVFVGFMGTAGRFMRVDIFPGDLIDIFQIRMVGVPGASLERSDDLASRLEAEVAKLSERELDTWVTIVGETAALDGANTSRGSHLAQVNVYLTPQDERERLTVDIVADFRERFKGFEGVDRLEFDLVKPGPPVGKALEIKVRGDDFAVLRSLSERIQVWLKEQAGTKDVADDYQEGKDELHVVVDELKAARLGLSVMDVARTVLSSYEGVETTVVREGKEEVAVRVRLAEPWRSEGEGLDSLRIRNRAGRMIELGEVAVLKKAVGLPTIHHHEGVRVITVGANVETDVVSSAALNARLFEAFQEVSKEHPGYSLVLAGEGKETAKIQGFMMKAFGLAVLMIYMILAMQFNSFFQPFILLLSIPLGLVGVIVALIAHDKPVSIMAMMGMVGLAGVVVNDAIVLVSFINGQRKRGVPLFEAIVEAGSKRFRPIVLTSITTVAGLFPIIYGWGGYEPFIAPAAIALAYGLIFATFLTLIVVPCTYYVFVDVKRRVRALLCMIFPSWVPHTD